MPSYSDDVPFDCSPEYATGNLAADTYANVTAEAGVRRRSGSRGVIESSTRVCYLGAPALRTGLQRED